MLLRLPLLAILLSAPSSACTAFVLYESQSDATPCAEVGDCPSGLACSDGTCSPVEEPLPPGVGVTIGPDGGVVDSPLGLRLEIPAGAVAAPVEILVDRASDTTPPGAFVPRSPFVRLSPAQRFDLDVRVRLDATDPDDACPACLLYGSEDDGDSFQGLPRDAEGFAAIDALGLFVLGLPEQP